MIEPENAGDCQLVVVNLYILLHHSLQVLVLEIKGTVTDFLNFYISGFSKGDILGCDNLDYRL